MQSVPAANSQVKGPDPILAAVLSVVPGCGHFYIGEPRKGILFLTSALISVLPLGSCIFHENLTDLAISLRFHLNLKINDAILNNLREVGPSSPQFLVLLALFVGFVSYAMIDAFKRADAFRRARYTRSIGMETSEATSGSYVAHSTLMAMFFVYCTALCFPPRHFIQTVDIEFEQDSASHHASATASQGKMLLPIRPRTLPTPRPFLWHLHHSVALSHCPKQRPSLVPIAHTNMSRW